jgi:predicted nucleotidyltransferase
MEVGGGNLTMKHEYLIHLRMDKSVLDKILEEYRKGLKAIFGEQLISVTLYGSVARGEDREDSDIDLLCVLRSPFDYAEAIRETSELTAELSLANDVVLSRVFVSEDDLQVRDLPFFMNIRREGIPV